MAQPAMQPISRRYPNETRPAPARRSAFKTMLLEDIDWKPFAAFPSSVRLAVIAGHPSEPGPYMIRVRVPSGVKLMPHRHPEDRIYTVISGVFYIGLGDEFNADKLEALSARRRGLFAGQQTPFSLGKVWRVHHTSNGDWAAGP